jgi:hypothetical protein
MASGQLLPNRGQPFGPGERNLGTAPIASLTAKKIPLGLTTFLLLQITFYSVIRQNEDGLTNFVKEMRPSPCWPVIYL